MPLPHDPRHQCAGYGRGDGGPFTCQPPWHFFGWFEAATAARLQEVARGREVALRCGERTHTWRRIDGHSATSVDVWVGDTVEDEALWHLWEATNVYSGYRR